jgi:hypothetical protein
MKKFKITIMVLIAVLLSCMFFMGCVDEDDNDDSGRPVKIQGNLIILQAYGNDGDGSPAGVSHSFVELYNISDKEIDLSGITLYYANGIRSTDSVPQVTADETWKHLALTGTIPAKGSFLILGPKHNDVSSTRYTIPNGYEDMSINNMSLSRRGFKVALISGSAQLTMQNPFDIDGDETKVSGYIDMVGAVNDPDHATLPDHIFGYETLPARNSASAAVRRKDLLDTDNNSTDFIEARYASTGTGAFTNEMLELRKPRNSSAGRWNPFAEPVLPETPTVAGTISENAGKLLIWQVGAATDGAITRSFVELYNNSNSSINLNTYSIQYANATGALWNKINLTGTIPAHGSYLVRGPEGTITSDSRLYIENADQTIDDFVLSNRNFKVALMENQNTLTVENPFDMTGGKAKDYVDLIGARNSGSDSIDAYETALAQVISKQAVARRKSLTDSNNNSTDYERIDYRVLSGSNGISDNDVVKYSPRSSSYGEWNPVTGVKKDKPPTGVTITGTGIVSGNLGLMKEAVITLSSTITPVDSDTTGVTYLWAVSDVSGTGVLTYSETSGNTFAITAADTGTATVTLTVNGGKISGSVSDSITVTVSTGTAMLMILQAYGTGDATDGSVSHTFVELYNNTNETISLTGYSLQYADGTKVSANATEDVDWTVITLTGTIPAKTSYLILGQNKNATGRLQITENSGDKNDTNFILSNRAFKVALMSNTTKLTVQNPFNTDGNGTVAVGYIDMVGATNDNTDQILGYETATARISKQVAVRRKSFTDSNDNSTDFESADFRTSGMDATVLDIKKPKNLTFGAWNPITGVKQ